MTTLTTLTLDHLDNTNAISVSARLELINSSDQDRVLLYPPTYMDGTYDSKHVISRPNSDGISTHILIDSVQSEARRMSQYYPEIEGMPDIFTTINDEVYSSVADLSHRIYDALLRDSTLDGTQWSDTEICKSLANASIKNATALYQYAPATMLFGGWDSHTGKSNPFRVARSISAEIWASNGEVMTRLATKGSPMVVSKDEQVYLDENHNLQVGDAPKGTKQKKPSEIGLGSVPSGGEAKGVIVDADSIRLTGSISLNRLNRYRFPLNGNENKEENRAARNVLAATGLYLMSKHLETGLDLRSGCDLETVECEWILRQGLKGKTAVEVNSTIAMSLLKEAVSKAENLGLKFADPIQLRATSALESITIRD